MVSVISLAYLLICFLSSSVSAGRPAVCVEGEACPSDQAAEDQRRISQTESQVDANDGVFAESITTSLLQRQRSAKLKQQMKPLLPPQQMLEPRVSKKQATKPLLFTEQSSPPPRPTRHPPDMGENHCRPTLNGIAIGAQKRLRREIHLWTDQEFQKFSHAVQILYSRSDSSISAYPTTYASFVTAHPFCHEAGAHIGPSFLPWHRKLLHDFETVLQNVSGDCELTLPFWNSNEEAGNPWKSVVFASNRYGMRPVCSGPDAGIPGASCTGQLSIPNSTACKGFEEARAEDAQLDQTIGGMCITDGIAGNWVMSDASTCRMWEGISGRSCQNSFFTDPEDCFRCVRRNPVANTLVSYPSVIAELERRQHFESMSDWIEFVPHIAPHATIAGGTMGLVSIAPYDPIFFLHHAYIEQLFAWWQEYQFLEHGIDTSTCETCIGKMLAFYNESLDEWLGRFDPEENCIMIPKSDPQICLSFLSHAPVPLHTTTTTTTSTTTHAQAYCDEYAPSTDEACTLIVSFDRGINASTQKAVADEYSNVANVHSLSALKMLTLQFGVGNRTECLEACRELSGNPVIDVVEFDLAVVNAVSQEATLPTLELEGDREAQHFSRAPECETMLRKFDLGTCEVGDIREGIVSTCEGLHVEAMKSSCKKWIDSTPGKMMSENVKQHHIHRCYSLVDELAMEDAKIPHLQPTDNTEAELCFRCSGVLGEYFVEKCAAPALPLGGATGVGI